MTGQGSLFEYDVEKKEWVFPEKTALIIALADRLEGRGVKVIVDEIDHKIEIASAIKKPGPMKDKAYNYLPGWLKGRFAAIGRQDGQGAPLVIAKIFNPCGRETWFLTEYILDTREFFGFCVGPFTWVEDEWGYSSLDELTSIRVPPLRLQLERDLWWVMKSANDIPEIKKVWNDSG